MHFLAISNDTLFLYYVLSNVIYLALLIVAIVKNVRHSHRLGSQRLELVKASPFTPPITLIVPAHNEERSIVGSVGALLGLEYPSLEVIVVNDGSSDATMEKMRQAYQLQVARILYIADIATAPLRAIYRSPLDLTPVRSRQRSRWLQSRRHQCRNQRRHQSLHLRGRC